MNAPAIRTTAIAVLVTCFGMNVLSRGASETFAVFLLPLEREFDFTRSQLTGVYSVYMLVQGLSAPLVGMAFDRFGARSSYGLGLLALACAYLLAARASALWQLYLCLGVLVGIGVAALSMVTASGLISRWFQGRLGTAMGLAYAGYGFGVIAVVPLTQLLIGSHGWRTTYLIMGGALLALLPVVVFVLPLRRWAAGREDLSRSRAASQARAPWTLRAAARDSAFWGLFNLFFFTSVSMYSVTVQAVAYLVDAGFGALQAATAFGFIGILSTCGMGSAGWLCDRIGPRSAVTVSFAMTMLGMAMLMSLQTWPLAWLLGVAIFVFGLPAGSRGPVISTLTASLFPGSGLGTIYGAISMGMGLGAATGSWACGALFDLTGGYDAGFVFALCAASIALAQIWIVPALRTGRRPGPPEPPEPPPP